MRCTKHNCNTCLVKEADGKVMLNHLWQPAYFILACLERNNPSIVKMVNDVCPNLTVCPECHVDDFVHVEGCKLDKEITKRLKDEAVRRIQKS